MRRPIPSNKVAEGDSRGLRGPPVPLSFKQLPQLGRPLRRRTQAVQVMKAGAVEFLAKPFGHSRLPTAIGEAIDRSGALLDCNAELRALKARYARGEREVMALVVVGLANKEVACELGISEVTVKAHRGSMMQKMEAQSLAHPVYQAGRLRLPRPNQKP